VKKVALISDLHSNLEALEAVLRHIADQGDVTSIYCLGDVVGYGPNPAEVIDLVREHCEFCLMGNHDMALTGMPLGFSGMAAQAIRWQRQMLEPRADSQVRVRERWAFIASLAEQERIGDDWFVHASPRHPVTEYLLPWDVQGDPAKLNEAMALVTGHCFVGHTHMPGVFTTGPRFQSSAELHNEYVFAPGQNAIVNVSSVGQPRDRDPRACYATVTDAGVTWCRVEYDIEKTIAKVMAIPELDARCGLRLRDGR